MNPEETERLNPTTVLIALLVMISSSLLGMWLAWIKGAGLAFVGLGLAYNLVFGALLWKGKTWAKEWLLGRYVVTLLFAGFLLFRYGDVLGAMYESLVSLCMIWILLGYASKRRAYSGVAVYAGMLLFLGLILFGLTNRQPHAVEIAEQAPHQALFESPSHYTVNIGELPWRILSREQAAQVLGTNIQDAELQMVRLDGSSFALFFPLHFRNVELNEQLTATLEAEIRERWLTHLRGWKSYPVEGGFFLTAVGEVDNTPVSYVVFYKHFGNLGVYAVFWAGSRNRQQLQEEATAFFDGMSAPPVKERLTRFSPSDIYAANHQAVVQINVLDKEGEIVSRGSGFNISPEGMVVTNLHVLLEGDQVEVVFPGQGVRTAQILGLSAPKTDLALLVVEGGELPTVQGFRSVDVVPGDVVYVIGNPRGLVNSLSEGIVGGVREEQEVTLYQITAPLSTGSSGGPVFNEYGEVIGVANSITLGAQNLNFSISIDELSNLFLLERPITLQFLQERLAEEP